MKILAVLLLIVSVPMLRAQEREPVMNLGGFAGYGLNTHTSSFKALPGVPCCSPTFEGGSGNGLSAGILAGLPLSSGTQIQLRLGYEGLHGTLLRDELIGNTLVQSSTAPFDTSTVDIITQHSMDATLNVVFLEPTFVWSPLQRLGLHIGVSGALLLTKNFRQKEELQSPSTVVFTGTESRVRNEAAGAIPDASLLLFHAVAGVSYDLPISSAAVLAPEVRMRVPLNSIAGVDWKVGALSFGTAFKVNIFAPEPLRYEQDTILKRDTVQQVIADIEVGRVRLLRTDESTNEERVGSVVHHTIVRNEYYVQELPAPRLDVALAVSGITRDGKKTEIPVVVVEEVLTQESFPLVPYLFFERNGTSLEPVQRQMTKSANFDTTALRFSSLAVYADLLNIIGARMQRFPASSIVITGCNGGEEENNNRTLSEQRAEEVKRFLATVWNIESKRITIKTRDLPAHPSNTAMEDGRAENRRVEISSLDDRLLEPIVLRTIERSVTPPVLVCEPEIPAATAATPWQLVVVREQDVLLDTAGVGIPPVVHWRPNGAALAGDSLFTARLTTTDEYGRTATAEQRILLRQITIARDRNEGQEVRIERFSLVLFDFNSTEIDRSNLRQLEQIRQRIRSGSQVRILGYTDRTGETEYNKKLAARRCREVQRLLGVSDAQIEAVGSDRLLYDNELPAGRMYSRTVHIIIETPVEKSDGSN